MRVARLERAFGAFGMAPVCAVHILPPLAPVAQVDGPARRSKDHRPGHERLGRGTWKIFWVEWALCNRDITCGVDEAREFIVRDRMDVDPKAFNGLFVDRSLLRIEAMRPHAERTAGYPLHAQLGLEFGHSIPCEPPAAPSTGGSPCCECVELTLSRSRLA